MPAACGSSSRSSSGPISRMPATPFASPRRFSSAIRSSSAPRVATTTLPQRSAPIPYSSQNAYIRSAPATAIRAFADPGR